MFWKGFFNIGDIVYFVVFRDGKYQVREDMSGYDIPSIVRYTASTCSECEKWLEEKELEYKLSTL